jgi:hypothetical protein
MKLPGDELVGGPVVQTTGVDDASASTVGRGWFRWARTVVGCTATRRWKISSV